MSAAGFYTTAAQVIPLIFVAIAFEGRAVWQRDLWATFGVSRGTMAGVRAIYLLFTLFFLVLGEASALWAIQSDAPIRFDSGYPAFGVLVGLVIGGASLFAQAFLQVLLEWGRGRDVNWTPAWIGKACVILVPVVATSMFGYGVLALLLGYEH